MEYIKNMEMANALFEKSYVKIEKTFFGLKTKILYAQTNSPMVATCIEYDPASGQVIKQLLETPPELLKTACGKIEHLEPAENGMYSLSLYYSQDHQFAALLLSKYIEFDYRPVGNVRFAEGPEAETLLHVLVK